MKQAIITFPSLLTHNQLTGIEYEILSFGWQTRLKRICPQPPPKVFLCADLSSAIVVLQCSHEDFDRNMN